MTDRPIARRIIYGGKLPGVIYIGPQKSKTQEVLDRMDRAWTKGAEEILSQIQKEDKEGKKPKIGTPPLLNDKNIEISKIRINPKGGGFSNTGGDLIDRTFSKISSSFRIAAASRRAFKQSGKDPKSLRRGYFFSKALGAEFGGDFRRRTRGTFSSAPDATQDPGLSKEDRFSAVLNRDLAARPQMVKQGDLFPQDSYTDKTPLQSILDIARKTADKINGLESGFVRIEKSQKETSAAFDKIRQNLTEVKNVYIKTADNFREFVDNKEQVIKIKEKIQSFKEKVFAEQKRDQIESQIEMFRDSAGVTDVKEVDQGLDEDEENVKEEDKGNIVSDAVTNILDGGGALLDDVTGRRTRIGSRRRLIRQKMGGVSRGIGSRLGGVGKVGAGIGRGIGKVGSGIGKGIGKVGSKIGSKIGGGLAKSIGKKIPGVGLIIGGLAAADRFRSGDIIGGIGELGSGIASIVPGVGTAISVGIDAALMGKDVAEAATQPETKLASGGIVAGEAGNEAVIPLSTAPAKKAIEGLRGGGMGSALGSVGPTLSAVAGIVRNPLYGAILGPTVNPILQPMLAKYKVPVYSADLGLFKASKLKSSSVKAKGKLDSQANEPEGEGNIFSRIGKFFSNMFGGGKKKPKTTPRPLPPGQVDPGVASMTTLTGIHKEAADLIAGYESSSSGGYNAMNRGDGGDSPEGSKHWLGKNLTEMTIGEIMALQAKGRGTLNAAGRYQFVGNTLPGAATKAGLSSSDKYTPLNQDKMFVAELRTSGHRPWTGSWGLGKYTAKQLDTLNKAVSTPVATSAASPTPDATPLSAGPPPPEPAGPAPAAKSTRPSTASQLTGRLKPTQDQTPTPRPPTFPTFRPPKGAVASRGIPFSIPGKGTYYADMKNDVIYNPSGFPVDVSGGRNKWVIDALRNKKETNPSLFKAVVSSITPVMSDPEILGSGGGGIAVAMVTKQQIVQPPSQTIVINNSEPQDPTNIILLRLA